MANQAVWYKYGGTAVGELPRAVQNSLETITVNAIYDDGSTTIDLSAMTVTGKKTDSSGNVTTVNGTLTGANGSFTWLYADTDVGTSGTYQVRFTYTDGATALESQEITWTVEASPGVSAIAGTALTGVSAAEAAFITATEAAGNSATEGNLMSWSSGAGADSGFAAADLVAVAGDTMSGPLIIDVTNAEALHVRKASDGGDVLRVDTTNGLVSIGAFATPAELFEVRGEVPDYTADTFGIRATLTSNITSDDSTFHWAGMLAQTIQTGAFRNGAWLAAMYAYYKQDGSGTQADTRSIVALNRINDGVATEVHGVYSDTQLTGDASAGTIYHFRAVPTVKNDTSTVTGNEYGLYVGNLTAGAENYGIYIAGANVKSFMRDTTFSGNVDLTTGKVLKLDDGSNSNPALTFAGDTDIGLYRITTNRLGIAITGQNTVEFRASTTGIGTVRGGVTPAAMLHVDNWGDFAQPVLYLDQADVSEEMIEFASTAGVGNAIELVGAKVLTVTEFIKVTINGNTRYIAAGTIA